MQISQETGLIQQDVYAVIQRLLDHVMDSLVKGNNVELRNFGVFEVKERKPRIGRNPNKPEQVVTIPSRKIVKFKPGKIMKLAITEGRPVSFLPKDAEKDLQPPASGPAS
jgi:nucleoid DNA-binding protein